ncbi:MAG: carboxypeptidase regulatory-like domain-containing protein, partial [Planctomycetes bacterium]|nr:carboxypeptidase regulatory-like domain-containing protein [Planctomycetota bacterium]
MRREPTRQARDEPWRDGARAPTTSGADGRFTCSTPFDERVDTVAVRLHKDGYCARVGRWPLPTAGETIDLGDVPMLRAIEVHGTVVDEHGVAVEGADLLFAHIALTGAHPAETRSMLRATSDAAGRFAFASPAHPGEWYVGAEQTGALVAPRSVKLDDETSYALRVVVERPDPRFDIRGTITDTAGRGLAGMRLSAQGEGFLGRGRSDARGAFVIRRAGPIPDRGKEGTSLSVSDPDGHYDRIRPPTSERIAWGSDGVEVVMRRRTGQSVRVVDPDGAAVTDYTLFVRRAASDVPSYGARTRRGHHPDGRCRIDDLPAGAHALLVMPHDDRLACSAPTRFEVTAGAEGPELVVTAPHPVTTIVTVADQRGRPHAASEVELLLAVNGGAPQVASAATSLTEWSRSGRACAFVVLANGRTDADGVCALAAPPGQLHVRVRGDGHVATVQAAVVTAPRTELAVAVRAAAVVRGRVVPAAALARLQ